MAEKKVIGRFAPSPTGPLHFGSLIAALASYLDAKSRNGKWLVRIEDLDPPREQAGADVLILKTLEAHGLEWDGAVMYQSKRQETYYESLDTLFNNNLAYYCTCSRKEIAAQNKPASKSIYPGTCRNSKNDYKDSAVRVITNQNEISFEDRLQGKCSYNIEKEFGDFVIKRKDGLFAYHLAVVIDDSSQNITDIIRGADLLESTPLHLYLQKILGLPSPAYLHLPVAVDNHGAKLSKQSFARPVEKGNEAASLLAALKYLNQDLPGNLEAGNKREILTWAISHWQPKSIPVAATIQVL